MFSKLINTRIQDIILSLPGDICRNVIILLRAYIDSQTLPAADTDPTAMAIFDLVRLQIDPILARRRRAAERRAERARLKAESAAAAALSAQTEEMPQRGSTLNHSECSDKSEISENSEKSNQSVHPSNPSTTSQSSDPSPFSCGHDPDDTSWAVISPDGSVQTVDDIPQYHIDYMQQIYDYGIVHCANHVERRRKILEIMHRSFPGLYRDITRDENGRIHLHRA